MNPLKRIPLDVFGNVVLSYLSLNDLLYLSLTDKANCHLVRDYSSNHIKHRVIHKYRIEPQHINTVLSGKVLWNIYTMFCDLKFNPRQYNRWFTVIDECINPLVWYVRDADSKKKSLIFRWRQMYYANIGCYRSLQLLLFPTKQKMCSGKINLSFLPRTADTIMINMGDQEKVLYYFDGNEENNEMKLNSENNEHVERKTDTIVLNKGVMIGGGYFESNTLDCKQFKIKLMKEKLIEGFDDNLHIANYHCIHLLLDNNRLKHIKNIHLLSPFMNILEITNQILWNSPLKNLNFKCMNRLEKLNLSGNDLEGNIKDLCKVLPETLKILNLNHNKKVFGCVDFKQLFLENGIHKIEEIVITGCAISAVTNFSGFLPQTLKILVLNNNQIQSDWNKQFLMNSKQREQSNLQRLSLCNNKITGGIDLKTMSQWMPLSLYLIDLHNNNLKGTIDLNHGLPPCLEEFDVSDNQIDIIGSELIEQNKQRYTGFIT